jgi:hypothetical protein
MKEVVHKVGGGPELHGSTVGVAHSSEEASFETLEGVCLARLNLAATDHPLFGSRASLVYMSVQARLELTM